MVTSRPQNSFVGAVDRYRQWLTEQVPTINAMTAYGNALFASTTANRLPRTTPTGSTRAPAGKTSITATCRPGWPPIDGMLYTRHDPEPALANGPSPTAATMTAVLTRPAPRQPDQCCRQMDGAAFRDLGQTHDNG